MESREWWVDTEQQVTRDVEYRPVVDAEDFAPLGQHIAQSQDAVVLFLNIVQALHTVLTGHVLVEDQRVDKNGRGHPQRLLAVRLLEMSSYPRLSVVSELHGLPHNDRRILYAPLEDLDRPLDGVFRCRRVHSEGCQISDAARYVAGLRKPRAVNRA